MQNILIDCDPGMDDSLALILAIKSPGIAVKAITTVSGNYHVDVTSQNALRVLELINATHIPVAKGADKPLIRPLPADPFSHGQDGQGENFLPDPYTPLYDRPAVDLIIETVRANPRAIRIVTLGPLTNIALALMAAPDIKSLIVDIIAIAGAFGINKYGTANATGGTPQSEWNVFVDPEAADLVFKSGIKVTAIGLDVATHFDVNLGDMELAKLVASPNAEAAFVSQMIRFVTRRGFQSYCVLIDAMAVAAVIDPGFVATILSRVGVETRGELTLGMTVLDARHHFQWTHLPEIQVAYEADYRRFLALVMQTITA